MHGLLHGTRCAHGPPLTCFTYDTHTYHLVPPYYHACSPGDFDLSPASADNQLIARAIEDPSSLNPIFFFIFNSLGLIPAVNLALLLPGAREQAPLPTAPLVGASFALGYGAVGPYLALREPRDAPISRAELGFFPRLVTESRLYGVGLVAGAAALAYGLLTMSDVAGARAEFDQLFASSKLVHVSTIDFAILSGLFERTWRAAAGGPRRLPPRRGAGRRRRRRRKRSWPASPPFASQCSGQRRTCCSGPRCPRSSGSAAQTGDADRG